MNRFLIFLLVFLFAFGSCDMQKNRSDHKSEGYLETSGAELYYRTTGSGDPLVVLHGGPGLSHKYLFPQLEDLLGDDFELIFYDQRASGWSSGVEDTASLTMDVFVEDLENIRKKLGLEKLNLAGHSFGGLLAMFYGIKYPENLNSIVLIDSDAASWELRTPHQIQTIRSRLSESDWQTMDSLERSGAFVNKDPEMIEYYFRIFLKSYFADPADITKLELGFDKQLVEKNVITSKFIRDNLGVYDVHEKLSAITCPVLIMIGRQSVFSVEGAKAIDDALPNSRLIIFENCGHFEYIEQPEQFEKAIKSFYGSINS